MDRSSLRRLLALGVAVVAVGVALEWVYHEVLRGVESFGSGFVESFGSGFVVTLRGLLNWLVAKPVLSLSTIGVVGCAVVLALLISLPMPSLEKGEGRLGERWRTSPWFRLVTTSVAILAVGLAVEWACSSMMNRLIDGIPGLTYRALMWLVYLPNQHLLLLGPALLATGVVLKVTRRASVAGPDSAPATPGPQALADIQQQPTEEGVDNR